MITLLPIPPSPSDPDNFAERGDALLSALPTFVNELNFLGTAYNLATTTTSSTSNSIGTGSKSFTVPSGLGYVAGMPVNIASTVSPQNIMTCYVVSYSGTSLVVNCSSIAGSGTFTAWSISLGVSATGYALSGANTDITSVALTNNSTLNGNQNSILGFVISNSNTGSSATAQVRLANDGGFITALKQDSTTNNSGYGHLSTNNTGGLVIESISATGQISFYTNAVNRFQLNTSGGYIVNGSVGTAGQVLKSGGSGVAAGWDDAIKFSAVLPTTSGTGISLAGIPSWAKRISIGFNNVGTNGAGNMQIQLGTSGGIQNTSYKSTYCYTLGGAVGSSANTSGFVIFKNSSTYNFSGELVLNLIDSANGTWSCFGILGDSLMSSVAGTKTLSGVLTQLLLSSTDTFNLGGITVSWE